MNQWEDVLVAAERMRDLLAEPVTQEPFRVAGFPPYPRLRTLRAAAFDLADAIETWLR